MSIRAKMRLEGVYANVYGGTKAIFHTQYDPDTREDRRFQKATPTGMAEFVIDNPAVSSQLIVGEHYFFDIVSARDEEDQSADKAA
jgi:hypothetical protein